MLPQEASHAHRKDQPPTIRGRSQRKAGKNPRRWVHLQHPLDVPFLFEFLQAAFESRASLGRQSPQPQLRLFVNPLVDAVARLGFDPLADRFRKLHAK